MTTPEPGVDLDAIAVEARVEIVAAQLLENEDGYYEAELASLRGAALLVSDAERDGR